MKELYGNNFMYINLVIYRLTENLYESSAPCFSEVVN